MEKREEQPVIVPKLNLQTVLLPNKLKPNEKMYTIKEVLILVLLILQLKSARSQQTLSEVSRTPRIRAAVKGKLSRQGGGGNLLIHDTTDEQFKAQVVFNILESLYIVGSHYDIVSGALNKSSELFFIQDEMKAFEKIFLFYPSKSQLDGNLNKSNSTHSSKRNKSAMNHIYEAIMKGNKINGDFNL